MNAAREIQVLVSGRFSSSRRSRLSGTRIRGVDPHRPARSTLNDETRKARFRLLETQRVAKVLRVLPEP
jgi:hypothetical protein